MSDSVREISQLECTSGDYLSRSLYITELKGKKEYFPGATQTA